MKTAFFKTITALVLILVFASAIGRAQRSNSFDVSVSVPLTIGFQSVEPETLVSRLDDAVPLTGEQKIRITEIFTKQAEALALLPVVDRAEISKEWECLKKIMEIRTTATAQVRALLTTEQQKKYDRTPQNCGGGLTINPANRVARLDEEVALTPEQKKFATEVYVEEAEELLMFSPEDRLAKGREIRRACKELIRALLTSEQREKLDAIQRAVTNQNAEEKAFVEQSLRASNAVVARVGTVSALSSQNSTVDEVKGQFRRGKNAYNVTGSGRSEVLTVSWERVLPDNQLKVLRIEDSTGQPIQP